MDEIVEYYVNPDLPSEEWDLNTLVSKVKEFVYLLSDLESNRGSFSRRNQNLPA